MAWHNDGSIEDLAKYLVFLMLSGELVDWWVTPGFFTRSFLWFLILSFTVCCMRISSRSERKSLRALEAEVRERSMIEFRDEELLEECKLRSHRREAIREGTKVDDGLSNFGRELQEARAQDHYWAKSMDRDVAKFGADYPEVHEDIFALEVYDKKVEAVWKRKVAAEAAWDKIRDGIR